MAEMRQWPAVLMISTIACGGETPTAQTSYPASEDWSRDIQHTELDISVDSLEAVARIELAGSSSAAASFEAAGLAVESVEGADGQPLEFDVTAGRLDVGLPPSEASATVVVRYRVNRQTAFNGLLESGSTLLWPYHCGNLFPCRSAPSDGLSFALHVRDTPTGQTTIAPERIDFESPSYLLAWATGDYRALELGETSGGTRLTAWHLPGGEDNAIQGTEGLVEAFSYFEERLGSYAYGDRAGVVAVEWGAGSLGGMEHHPYWHVAAGAMNSTTVQIHEAAHGWFGNGVRIDCWEDFVLSEGTVSYLAARATAEVFGEAAADTLWTVYDARLTKAMLTTNATVAWPEGCGVVDIIEDELFTNIPYMKGAFFFRALELRIGVEALMDVLSRFYQDHVGRAARMHELLEAVQADTGYDPTSCADAWLRSYDVPELDTCP
jgi:aminopeptidase N